ncbi:ATP-dependent DNA helicase RecG [Candidatus Cryosericum hinesii]|uniref:ATP-dependent DNA helicase RecG n=1 Tax=Candidatus Cryosericum hinesii TaxID=2290915 RepID=UPI0014022E5E|nr:ATP-dependent DNA helicase RecG [Candidatus Cryosericum hinesii]
MSSGGSPAESDTWKELLRGLVRLELKRGCQDDAAVGGFARLALVTVEGSCTRTQPAAEHGVSNELRSLLVDYQFLPNHTRADRCSALLALLDDSKSPLAGSPLPAGVPPARATSMSKPPADSMNALLEILEEPVSKLWGVGPRVQEIMGKLGVHSIADLLQHAPKGYLDLRYPAELSRESLGQMVLIKGRLLTVTEIRRKVLLVKASVRDPGGRVFHLVWFNNKFVKSRLQAGHDYDFYGRLENSFEGAQLMQPAFEESGTPAAQLHMNRIVPLYHLTSGITQKGLRAHVWRAVGRIPSAAAEYLPRDVASHFKLPDLAWSYRSLHFPTDEHEAEKARSRFAFDSLFLFELRVLMRRHAEQDVPGNPFDLPTGTVERYVGVLPFVPTGSQAAAMRDIEGDVRRPRQMHRLLHGDVGSGKTAVAGYAAYAAKVAGYQSAVLSPTEILAEQTGRVLQELLAPLGVRVATLTGGMTKSQRRSILGAVATGEVDCLVGTHAILEEGVAFERLGLSVVDEQHRFGVAQRVALGTKGNVPHSLVMSATPIPRTLALTIYGDLDISELVEKPAGRFPIQTHLLTVATRDSAYAMVREQVAQGRQAFIVVPAIDPASDEGDGTASVEETMRDLTEGSLKGLRVASLHGRMKSSDKQSTMDAFRLGNLDALVATTVVEVGVDVPNASVMVIEDAERFGLATLHQLRGRVGRGSSVSHCILIQGNVTAEGTERLQVLVHSDDGFQIAEEDLKLRGPGDILGTVQHGYDVPLFGSTALLSYRDLSALPDIRKAASELLEHDPSLGAPEHADLACMLSLRYPASKPGMEDN